MEKFKSETIEMDSQRKNILKNMEEQLAASTDQADHSDAESKQNKKIIEQLKSGEWVSGKCMATRVRVVDQLEHPNSSR